jgi:hypothetical protein
VHVARVGGGAEHRSVDGDPAEVGREGHRALREAVWGRRRLRRISREAGPTKGGTKTTCAQAVHDGAEGAAVQQEKKSVAARAQ